MKIRNFSHKGLRRLYEEDSPRGIPPATASKLRDMLAALEGMSGPEKLTGLLLWRAHQLSGERKGEWSLFVTKNWRLTFRIDPDQLLVCDLNLEDYH